ncbi:hypothetical protein SP15_194 [Bacillus phage SP-15]|uniref:Uncharacterized protein n=1 Tax=Bacillus phage SP-15 TaxID=1792032 RepID=A0A127AXQ6_9CAUD|nr:hypothetical protein SP15_194 [Bacillus phage SP-15]AMM44994.1 hypothetical protein SP15_194 [Bacillus phage SP-15]
MITTIISPKGTVTSREGFTAEQLSRYRIYNSRELRVEKASMSRSDDRFIDSLEFLTRKGYIVIERSGDSSIEIHTNSPRVVTPGQYIALIQGLYTWDEFMIHSLVTHGFIEEDVTQLNISVALKAIFDSTNKYYYDKFRSLGCNTHDYNRDSSQIEYLFTLLDRSLELKDDKRAKELVQAVSLALRGFNEFCEDETSHDMLVENYLSRKRDLVREGSYISDYVVNIRRYVGIDKYLDYGLSGYLAPDGQFYECRHQEHDTVAQKLVEKYKLDVRNINSNRLGDFIKFGISPWINNKIGDHGCHVFLNLDEKYSPTKEQVQWLENNWHRMTDKQAVELLRNLRHFGLDTKFKEIQSKLITNRQEDTTNV